MQRILMTSGSYSDYGVDGLLEGPDEPSIKVLVETFNHEVLPSRTVVREGFAGKPYPDTVRDPESARLRLLTAGVPVSDKEYAYGRDGGYYNNDGSVFLRDWLIAACGFQQIVYVEIHDGEVDRNDD